MVISCLYIDHLYLYLSTNLFIYRDKPCRIILQMQKNLQRLEYKYKKADTTYITEDHIVDFLSIISIFVLLISIMHK